MVQINGRIAKLSLETRYENIPVEAPPPPPTPGQLAEMLRCGCVRWCRAAALFDSPTCFLFCGRNAAMAAMLVTRVVTTVRQDLRQKGVQDVTRELFKELWDQLDTTLDKAVSERRSPAPLFPRPPLVVGSPPFSVAARTPPLPGGGTCRGGRQAAATTAVDARGAHGRLFPAHAARGAEASGGRQQSPSAFLFGDTFLRALVDFGTDAVGGGDRRPTSWPLLLLPKPARGDAGLVRRTARMTPTRRTKRRRSRPRASGHWEPWRPSPPPPPRPRRPLLPLPLLLLLLLPLPPPSPPPPAHWTRLHRYPTTGTRLRPPPPRRRRHHPRPPTRRRPKRMRPNRRPAIL